MGVQQTRYQREERSRQALNFDISLSQTLEQQATHVSHIPRHLAKAREAIPDLPYDDLPDLRFSVLSSIFRSNLATENSLRQGAEVGREEGEGVIGSTRPDQG